MKLSGYYYIHIILFGLLLATSCIVAPNLYSGAVNAKIIWLPLATSVIAFVLSLVKLTKRGLYLVFFLLINSGCFSQMMRNINDSQKILENQEAFLNRPLKNLLKEIGPEIKMVTANPSNNSNSRLGYFIFRFIDAKKYDSLQRKNIYPKQITVFVKESFDWDFRSKDRKEWTKADLEKYGNLTVVGIRVFGKE